MVGRVLAGHQQAVHIFRPQCINCQHCHQGRIDAAAQSQHRTLYAVLVEVVGQAFHQPLIHQFHGLGLLVVYLLYLLHVHSLGALLEIGHLHQHATGGIDGHGPAGKEVAALATGAVGVHQADIEGLHNLGHAVTRAVGLLVVEDIAAAAYHHIGLVHMAFGQLLEVLVETYGQPLVVELDDLHTLAPHKATLLVWSQILLRDDGTDGTVLYKNDGVAESFVLNLEGKAHQEGTVLRALHQLLQGRLGALLYVGIAGRGKEGGSTQRAGREDGKQRFA